MNVESHLQAASRRLFLVRTLNGALIALSPILWALIFFLTKNYIGFWLSTIGATVTVVLGSIVVYRFLSSKRPLSEEASLALDRGLNTKERFISLELLRKDKESEYAKALGGIIEKQLASVEQVQISPTTIIPFSLERETKRSFFALLPAIFGILVLLYVGGSAATVEASFGSAKLREIAEEHTELPADLRKELENLADTIDENPSDTEAIESALKRAEQELEQAREAANQDGSRQEGKTIEEESPQDKKSETTPTPTPNAEEKKQDEEKKEGEEEKQAKKDDGDSKSGNSPDQKGDQEKKDSKSEDGSGKSDKKDKQEKGNEGEGDGQGEGGKSKKEDGKGSQEGSKGEKGSKGKDGKAEGDSQGDSKEESKGGEKSQDGSQSGEGKSDDSKGEQGKEGSEEGSGNSGMKEAASALSEVRENLDKKAQDQDKKSDAKQPGEEGKKAGDKQSDSKDGSSGKGEKGEKPQEREGKSGGQGKSDSKNDQKPPEKSEEPNASGDSAGATDPGKDDDKQNPLNKEGEQRSLPKPNETEAKERELGEGPNPGDVFGPNKGYEEKVLDSANEKLDTRYTEQTGKLSKNEKESAPKVSLDDVTLAKPDPVRDKGDQPIPLEYRDVLK